MSIRRNTFFNLAGSLSLVAVSLVTIPLFLHRIGDARYGVLAIVMLLLGYFNFFDLGLARATANRIARLRDAPDADREQVFWTALGLNTMFGVLGGLVLYGVAGFALSRFFKMPEPMRVEVLSTLPWLAVAIPLATVSGVLVGALEGRERFGLVNALQVFGSILFQTVPLAVAYLHGPDLTWLIPAAILARGFSVVPLAVAAAHAVPVRFRRGPRRRLVRPLLGYGGWITITGLANPILETLDRVLIGGILGAAAVTYYTVPYELSSRFRILPGALTRSLFPRMSAQTREEASRQAEDSLTMLAVVMTPLIVFGILIMRPFLGVWVGHHFSVRAAPVGELLLVGIWLNSLAFLPYTQLQAQGRPDLVAKFHALELVPFIGLLWAAVSNFGLLGAAMAYTLRVVIDALLLFWAAKLWRRLVSLWFGGSLVIVAWLGVEWIEPALFRLTLGLLLLSTSVAWAASCEPRVRAVLVGLIGGKRPPQR
jgi:O-antigen/teichoic acid export membrane protein